MTPLRLDLTDEAALEKARKVHSLKQVRLA
jgi:hypothetical protein